MEQLADDLGDDLETLTPILAPFVIYEQPPVAQERIHLDRDGPILVREFESNPNEAAWPSVDPLSLLCRLATSVPPPRFPPSGIAKRVTP